jgi:prepilin-type N-terminal cleavage/methylation domain-containing protein
VRIRQQSGFSLLELAVTLSVVGILSVIVVAQIGQAIPGMKADGAMRVVISQLTTARELAISQRRYVQVKFVAPSQIQTIRVDVNTSGGVTGTTILSTVSFEGGVTYNKLPDIPDTPDAFGFASAVDFGSATTIQFATDGELIDQAGGPLNGTVVLASPNKAISSRAVTILGATGHIRAYRWTGKSWALV